MKYIVIINLTHVQILKGLEECARGGNHFLARYGSFTSSFRAVRAAPIDTFISTRSIPGMLLLLGGYSFEFTQVPTQFLPTASSAYCWQPVHDYSAAID